MQFFKGFNAYLFNFGKLHPGIGIGLPPLKFNATGIVETFGQLNITLPKMDLGFSGQDWPIGTINVSLKKELQITGLTGPLGVLSLRIPRLTFDASAGVGETGTISVTLPALKFLTSAAVGAVGTMSVTLPMARISFNALSSVEGSLTLTIPMIQLLFGEEQTVDTEVMVLNLKNTALSKYDNYPFGSMCQIGSEQFGAVATGIYKLSGSLDADTPIEWNIRTGFIDLEQKEKKKVRQAWFSGKSSGDILVSIVLPSGEIYEYDLESYEITEDGVRVKFGKGIRSKYFAIDVQNVDGSSIDLDVIKVQYVKTQKPR